MQKNRIGQVRTGLDVVLSHHRRRATHKAAQVWLLLKALQKMEAESRQRGK